MTYTNLKAPFFGRRMFWNHDLDCPWHVEQYYWECDCHHGLWFWAW